MLALAFVTPGLTNCLLYLKDTYEEIRADIRQEERERGLGTRPGETLYPGLVLSTLPFLGSILTSFAHHNPFCPCTPLCILPYFPYLRPLLGPSALIYRNA